MKPYAMAEQMTTPNGWKMERAGSSHLRFCGRSSRQIVVSIGTFPPIPSPTKAVRMRTPLYVFGAARQMPKTLERRTVKLNAQYLPMMST